MADSHEVIGIFGIDEFKHTSHQVFHYMFYKHSSEIYYCLTWINTENAFGCTVSYWERNCFKNSAFGAVAFLNTDNSSASPVLASFVPLSRKASDEKAKERKEKKEKQSDEKL